MNFAVDNDIYDFACKLSAEAALLTLNWFQKRDLGVSLKKDNTEVTDADKAVEEFLRKAIGNAFPNDTIIGEEQEISSGSSERTWIIDPIDGTASFVRGVPLYSSLLAMVDEHGPAIGTIHLPALDKYVTAGRGLGAISSESPISVSPIQRLTESCISSSSFDMPWWPESALQAVLSSGAKTRTWGDGYGYFLVAIGSIEAMVDPSLYVYDIAPMLTIIPECGGLITTWSGEASLVDGHGWVATNGLIHEHLLRVLQ